MIAARLLKRLLAEAFVDPETGVQFHFSDGTDLITGADVPSVTFRFLDAGAEWSTLLLGHIGLLESYFDQRIEVDGDIRLAFRAGMESGFSAPNPLVALRNEWHELRFSNRNLRQAKANARFHYGLPREFFRFWLDLPAMMYTCAYWKEGTGTLEEAQRNKIEHVCRKLQLQPGETVADIGCGWGGFMFHAAEHYDVLPVGFNATTEQVVALREDIGRRGLGGRLEVHECDFREVTGQFDKVAHIGVLEHAGRGRLKDAIRALARCVKPGGLGVLHFIGHVGSFSTEFFIRHHIFPGGWIPSLTETLNLMEREGLEILDVENLRRHYALTLDAWAERFDRHWEDIQRLDPTRFDEPFRRQWRAYLYGCAEMFRSPHGYTHLFQITFSKGNVGYAYPMSRSHLYRDQVPLG